MKIYFAILCCIPILTSLACDTGTKKQVKAMGMQFQQDWQQAQQRQGYEIPIFQLDPNLPDSSLHNVLVRQATLNNQILEQYISQNTHENSTILRIINYFHVSGFETRHGITRPVNIAHLPRAVLCEICWVIQDNPDSLRFVFLKDRQNTNSLIDTTLPYHEFYIKTIISYPVKSPILKTVRDGPYPYGAIFSAWSKNKAFHFQGWSLWKHEDCDKSEISAIRDINDSIFIKAIIQVMCQAHKVGGFYERCWDDSW